MVNSPFEISIDTVIGTAQMLGHDLEDRARIRSMQDPELLKAIQAASTVTLKNAAYERSFCVAPLDILVTHEQSPGAGRRKQFHIIELNGTGIGGLTNLCEGTVRSILDSLVDMAWHHPAKNPLILVAVSGKEDKNSPRLNRLIYEKMLYVDALRQGFQEAGFQNVVTTNLDTVLANPATLEQAHPTIVLGYIGELLDALTFDRQGRLLLGKRYVTGAVNDRFCLNVLDRFGHCVDMDHFEPMNRCFLAGGDKGVMYELLNAFQEQHHHPVAPQVTEFERVHDRESLIHTVSRWVRDGISVVIKPHGTGVGHGIEFFLNPEESDADMIRKIDDSIETTAHYYRMPGGAFPYTVCRYLNTAVVEKSISPYCGHKYELRVVVYRDRGVLRAFPAIVKVAPAVYQPGQVDKQSLINNITHSGTVTRQSGVEHMLPLCHHETLEMLDLTVEELTGLCQMATQFVHYVLQETCLHPERYFLAGRSAEQHPHHHNTAVA